MTSSKKFSVRLFDAQIVKSKADETVNDAFRWLSFVGCPVVQQMLPGPISVGKITSQSTDDDGNVTVEFEITDDPLSLIDWTTQTVAPAWKIGYLAVGEKMARKTDAEAVVICCDSMLSNDHPREIQANEASALIGRSE